MTARLLYRGLTPPLDREAWGHEETPSLLQDHLRTLIRSRDRRNDLSDRLTALYWLRLNADYRGVRPVVSVQIVRAGRDARFILRAADEKLTQHKAEARHVMAVIPSGQAEERRGYCYTFLMIPVEIPGLEANEYLQIPRKIQNNWDPRPEKLLFLYPAGVPQYAV